MAKRSDFAQKLLDDLRLRKERMAAAQKSSHSNQIAGDGYGYSQQGFRGSGDLKSHETASLRRGGKKSGGGNRLLTSGETTTQLVPFEKGRKTEQIGDLSMALTFALQNGGKFRKLDSSSTNTVLSFLHQFGSRKANLRMPERSNSFDRRVPSTGQYPTLTHLHVKEISKGAQKLNQILRACSNGVNFDKYSIEVGKELLKGAVDLEESLRMLVNLQEASDYMITPQRKSKVRLVEVGEEENEDATRIVDEKQVERPRFSFDKPSRDSQSFQEVSRSGASQRFEALMNAHEEQALVISTPGSHRRSASYGSDLRSSQSKSEKGRISNVIAKLMGLEELPENSESKNKHGHSTSKSRMDGIISKKAEQGSTINAEFKTRYSESSGLQITRQQVMKSNRPPETWETATRQAERSFEDHGANFKLSFYAGKPLWDDLERTEGTKRASRQTIVMNKQQSIDGCNSTCITNGWKKVREDDRRKGNGIHTEQKSIESVTKSSSKGEAMGMVLSKTRRNSYGASILQENSVMLKTNVKEEIRNLPRSLEQKHQAEATEHGSMQQRGAEAVPRVSKPLSVQTNSQKSLMQTNQGPHSNTSSMETIRVRSSHGSSRSKQEEDLSRKKSNNHLIPNKSTAHNGALRDKEIDQGKEKSSDPQDVERQPTHVPSTLKKAADKKVHKREVSRRVDELTGQKCEALPNLAKPLKSKLQESKQIRRGKAGGSKRSEREMNSSSAKAITRLNRSVRPLHVAGKLQKQRDDATTIESPCRDECQTLNEAHTATSSSNDIHHDIISADNYVEQSPSKGTHQGRMGSSHPSQPQQHGNLKLWRQEPLTETENNLKKILAKSQVFLDTADALFELNIPVGVLHAGGDFSQYEDSNVMLDSGFEVMKRKGRRLELAVHPKCNKIAAICSLKIRSLDDLVKQLHIDIKNLRLYGLDGRDECDAADYLYKMLEKDVQNKDPDLNCMWDLGWNDIVFAYIERDQVIRDVEKHVLSGLLDEITEEFFTSLSI